MRATHASPALPGTAGPALLTSRADRLSGAVAVDASRPSTRAKLSSANQKSPISDDGDRRRPRGEGWGLGAVPGFMPGALPSQVV